jgi:CBS domain-containing protein
VVSQSDLVDPDRDRTDVPGRSHFYRMIDDIQFELGDDAESLEGVVTDVMTPAVLNIAAEAPVADAARVMLRHGVHRLIVTDGARLVGLVTTMDVMRALVPS